MMGVPHFVAQTTFIHNSSKNNVTPPAHLVSPQCEQDERREAARRKSVKRDIPARAII